MTIKERGAELNLVKKDDVWRVAERADYPADFDKVSALIRKLWELRPVQEVKIGPSQLGRLQLVEPSQGSNDDGTLLDLKGANDKRLAALLLGKKLLRNSDQPTRGGANFPVGRYVMGQDASHRVFLISDTLDETQTKPEQWLNHDFIKVENPRSIAVAGATAGVNWIIRETASSPWRLVDAKQGEELDNAKISILATLFSGASSPTC